MKEGDKRFPASGLILGLIFGLTALPLAAGAEEMPCDTAQRQLGHLSDDIQNLEGAIDAVSELISGGGSAEDLQTWANVLEVYVDLLHEKDYSMMNLQEWYDSHCSPLE